MQTGLTEECMRRLVVKVLKNETILVVASILALISCFIVPPDKEYAGYIHASTISQLICLMLVVCASACSASSARACCITSKPRVAWCSR